MKVLIVTHDFPPSASASSVRPWLLACGLSEAGHEVVVLTAQSDPERGPFALVSIPYVPLGRAAKGAVGIKAGVNLAEAAHARGRLAAAAVRRGALLAESLLTHPDKQSGWIPAVRAASSEDGWIADDVDVVIGMPLPMSSAVIAADLSERAGASLVLDFRDLWSDNRYYPYGRLRRSLDRARERRLLPQAANLVAVTNGLAAHLKTRVPDERVRVIFNAAKPVHGRPGRSSGCAEEPFRLGFFGTTYGGRRDLRPVLSALQSLASQGLVDLGLVRLDFYGQIDPDLLTAVDELSLTAIVSVHGIVAKHEADEALLDTHVALVPTWPEDLDSLPLKAIEYLEAGRTLLVTGARPDSEIWHDLAGVEGVLLCSEEQEIEGAVLDLWRAWESGEDLYWPKTVRPNPFSADRLIAGYDELLSSIARERAGGR